MLIPWALLVDIVLASNPYSYPRGANLLFADADGATTFEDLIKLEENLAEIETNGHGIVCGSRAHLEEESIASRTVIRTVLMYGFHACVWIFAVKTVKDTQCGFKVYFCVFDITI